MRDLRARPEGRVERAGGKRVRAGAHPRGTHGADHRSCGDDHRGRAGPERQRQGALASRCTTVGEPLTRPRGTHEGACGLAGKRREGTAERDIWRQPRAVQRARRPREAPHASPLARRLETHPDPRNLGPRSDRVAVGHSRVYRIRRRTQRHKSNTETG